MNSSKSKDLAFFNNSFLDNSEELNDFGLKFQIKEEKYNIPVKSCFYLLTTKEGQEYSGFTDQDGFTKNN